MHIRNSFGLKPYITNPNISNNKSEQVGTITLGRLPNDAGGEKYEDNYIQLGSSNTISRKQAEITFDTKTGEIQELRHFGTNVTRVEVSGKREDLKAKDTTISLSSDTSNHGQKVEILVADSNGKESCTASFCQIAGKNAIETRDLNHNEGTLTYNQYLFNPQTQRYELQDAKTEVKAMPTAPRPQEPRTQRPGFIEEYRGDLDSLVPITIGRGNIENLEPGQESNGNIVIDNSVFGKESISREHFQLFIDPNPNNSGRPLAIVDRSRYGTFLSESAGRTAHKLEKDKAFKIKSYFNSINGGNVSRFTVNFEISPSSKNWSIQVTPDSRYNRHYIYEYSPDKRSYVFKGTKGEGNETLGSNAAWIWEL